MRESYKCIPKYSWYTAVDDSIIDILLISSLYRTSATQVHNQNNIKFDDACRNKIKPLVYINQILASFHLHFIWSLGGDRKNATNSPWRSPFLIWYTSIAVSPSMLWFSVCKACYCSMISQLLLSPAAGTGQLDQCKSNTTIASLPC